MAPPHGELLPSFAVLLFYRRYLKAAMKVPNVTIRYLLLSQIRSSFRRNRTIKSAAAQRELVAQAKDDLMILEDERHSRTLYINKFGMVSCLEWECRRNDYSFTPKGLALYQIFFAVSFAFFFHVAWNLQFPEQAEPQIAKTVELMAARLECDDPSEIPKIRARDRQRAIDDAARINDLERRIYANFRGVPDHERLLPSPTHPTPTQRHQPGLISHPQHE